jgi:hypothetical protein
VEGKGGGTACVISHTGTFPEFPQVAKAVTYRYIPTRGAQRKENRKDERRLSVRTGKGKNTREKETEEGKWEKQRMTTKEREMKRRMKERMKERTIYIYIYIYKQR